MKDSTINTFGSECFEVKENAHHNRMENVDCGYNDEPLANQGSNVELRGDHNTVLRQPAVREPQLEHEARVGLAATYDKGGNTAQRNDFSAPPPTAIINRQTGSGPFCGNTFPPARSATPAATASAAPPRPAPGATTPTVTARTPAVNATAVAVGDNVTATFSEAVQPVSAARRSRSRPVRRRVAATVTLRRRHPNRHPDPTADLAANTQYTATLTGGASAIRGATGTPLATVSWTFTTAAAPPADTTAPTVTARTPAANATGVAVGTT